MKQISYLENKVLGCWCESGCHGEVLIKLYHEYKNESAELQIKELEQSIDDSGTGTDLSDKSNQNDD